jgi:pseudaminic acid synthase
VPKNIKINNREIGKGSPAYIIAELSGNHRQNYDEAVELIYAAKNAGADAVKLQTYTPDTITIQSERPEFKITQGLWAGRTLYDLYKEAFTPWEWQPRLKKVADELGLTIFSTPFDNSAVDLLESMNVPAYKIASYEIVDIPLIEYVASKGKPMIISTGNASLSEIEEAVISARKAGNSQLILLKCTSSYPAPPEDMNLRTIPHLGEAFRVIPGLSDHTLGISVPIAAITLGASVIEKHLTLSHNNNSVDGVFSLDPQEFKTMVEAIRIAEKALGEVVYPTRDPDFKEINSRRSLYVVKDVRAGERFTEDSVRSIRPNSGLHPRYLKNILGRRAANDIEQGTPLNWELIS